MNLYPAIENTTTIGTFKRGALKLTLAHVVIQQRDEKGNIETPEKWEKYFFILRELNDEVEKVTTTDWIHARFWFADAIKDLSATLKHVEP